MPKKIKPVRWDKEIDQLVSDYVKKFGEQMQQDGILPYTTTTGEMKPNAGGALRHALKKALGRD